MIKTLQNTLKQDKEGFVLPRSVQDAIPIRRLWPDGIFQFGSKFSKTIRFSDINYAIASKEDKTSMFLGYSELLNALDTGSTTKITINNKRLNRQNFEQEILIPRQDDYLDGYRAEYNAMLMDKVTDSSNSVVQERYITLSVHRKSIEEARAFFDRVTADVTTRLSHLDAHSEELDAVERLRVLHDFYRTGEETEYHLDLHELMQRGHSFKDSICPDSLEFKKDHFIMGRTVARNVASFSCGPSAILYVDRDNVLWGRGSSKHLLLLEEPGRVRLMEDVKQAAVGTHHALALKTDGSFWSWGENNWGGLGLGTKDQASYPPQKILEGILDIFVIDDASFAITQEGTLLFWGNSERLVPEPIAEDVVSVSWLEANLYQYLTRQGSVYAMPSPFTEMPRRMIAKDVRFLCGGGFVKEDQSQWKWERTAGDGALVKVRDGVQAAASAYFYATDDGRLHWVKRGSALAPVSKSVRNITPVLRNTVLLLFLSLWLLRRRRKKVQPKGEFNNPQQENL